MRPSSATSKQWMVEPLDGRRCFPLLPLVSDEHSPSIAPTVLDSPSPLSVHSRSRSPKERNPASTVEEASLQSTTTLALHQETEDFLNPGSGYEFELHDCYGPSYSDRVWLHNDNFEDEAIYRAARMSWQQSSSSSWQQSSSSNRLFCTSELNFNRQRCNNVRNHRINEMVSSLPLACQAEARLRLDAIEFTRDIKLMVQESPSVYIEGLISSKCNFYIGISERPKERFELHTASGYKEMALWIHPSRIETVKLEKYLINKFRSSHLMANIADGGQAASAARPHFLYVVSR